MGQKTIPTPVVAAVIVVVILLAGFFLYKGATGGTVGEGEPGKVETAPPMPKGVSNQQYLQMQTPRR